MFAPSLVLCEQFDMIYILYIALVHVQKREKQKKMQR